MSEIRLEYPKFQALSDDGLFLVGGKLYTYVANSTTPVTTYYNRDLSPSHANTNPVILNARGECLVFTNQAIKLVLKTSDDVQIWEQDYLGDQPAQTYTGSSSGTTGNVYNITVTPVPLAYTANMTVVFTPDVTNVDTIGSLTFSGTGANDCQINGPYVGSISSVFQVQIDSDESPNTFQWRKDAGEWVTGVAITGAEQTLIEGMTVKFSTLTGHTLYSYWLQDVVPPAKVNVSGLGEILVYKNQGGEIVAIDGGDIIAGYPATFTYSDVHSCAILTNPATFIQDSDANVGKRIRTEKTGDYSLLVTDKGNLIDFNDDEYRYLLLDAAANFNGMFFYVRSAQYPVQIISSAGELIYGQRAPSGTTIYQLDGWGSTVQLQCNGVSWEVLMERRKAPTREFITENTLWTPPAGCSSMIVEVIGGGAGGTPYIEGVYEGSDGYGGGYASKIYDYVQTWGDVWIEIGAGGTAGSSSPSPPYYISGGNGGTTSFGGFITATGGSASEGGIGYGSQANIKALNVSAAGPYSGASYYGTGGLLGANTGWPGLCIITEYY